MTKVYDGVTVLTYDEWQKKPEVQQLYGESTECSTCDGTGEHDCECGDTHTCGACNGSGKVVDLREMYERELRDEISRLHAWQEGKALKHVSGPTPHAPDKGLSWPTSVILSIPGSSTGKAADSTPAAPRR